MGAETFMIWMAVGLSALLIYVACLSGEDASIDTTSFE